MYPFRELVRIIAGLSGALAAIVIMMVLTLVLTIFVDIGAGLAIVLLFAAGLAGGGIAWGQSR